MNNKLSTLLTSLFLFILLVAGCTLPAEPLTIAGEQVAEQPSGTEPVELVMGLGYIPSVQFAPFYVAQEMGLFEEQGLEVTFQHGSETDFLKLVATDVMPFVVASGEQVILARAQELPVTYAMAWYREFPVGIFALEDKNITGPADLAGRRVGISGMFGASLVAWKAMVYATGIPEEEVTLETIGFSQAAAVSQGRVDAAIDYIANGPVQLKMNGEPVSVIAVSEYIDLPSNGLVVSDRLIARQPEVVQKTVTALLKAIRYTLDNPDEAFEMSLRAVPEAGGDARAINRAVFDATLEMWQASAEDLGQSDPQSWQEAAEFMLEVGLIDRAVVPEDLFTNQFVDSATMD
ncbi:MAG: ABC transporter substrate-binding protein [Chloroflexota bacterium]|nr:ABC transporter substrate-binding protein [Chloroflexota bacterium]